MLKWKPTAHLTQFAKAVDFFAKWYHDFELIGEENIPKNGAAMIVFYHGLIPLDAWYFGLKYYLKTGRMIRGLGDRWLFKTPGLKWLVETVGGVEGRPEIALELLRQGELVGVSPGGVQEAIKGDNRRYQLVWGHRTGFAKLALEANVPIIPGFCENVEEMYRAPFAHRKFFQNLYEKTRLPLVPMIGLGALPFPVKLRVHLGEPIYHQAGESAENLRERTFMALEKLMQKNQIRDQTILQAMRKRFTDKSV